MKLLNVEKSEFNQVIGWGRSGRQWRRPVKHSDQIRQPKVRPTLLPLALTPVLLVV